MIPSLRDDGEIGSEAEGRIQHDLRWAAVCSLSTGLLDGFVRFPIPNARIHPVSGNQPGILDILGIPLRFLSFATHESIQYRLPSRA
jgi:hypothetical protein